MATANMSVGDREFSVMRNMTDGSSSTELYAVVWSGFILLILLFVGTLPNLALLFSTRCKRKICSWKYGLVYNMCVTNLVFCVLWTPLNFGVILSGYVELEVNYVICYSHTALFYLCVTVLVCSAVFLGVQRLLAIWSPVTGVDNNAMLCFIGVGLSWASGCLCAVYVSLDYSATLSYSACTRSLPVTLIDVSPHSFAASGNHWAETVICLVYVAALFSTLLIFLILCLYRRHRIHYRLLRKTNNCSYHGITSKHNKPETGPSSSTSKTSPLKSSIHMENSDIKKSSGALSVSKKVCLKDPKAEDIHNISDDDVDDDQFDLKMRLKMSKRSSGRRHTVANIGLAEPGYRGRRGSMDCQTSSGPNNYQYVRKWSVDITALQNQLENPKVNPLPFKELVEFRNKKHKEQEANNAPDEGPKVTQEPASNAKSNSPISKVNISTIDDIPTGKQKDKADNNKNSSQGDTQIGTDCSKTSGHDEKEQEIDMEVKSKESNLCTIKEQISVEGEVASRRNKCQDEAVASSSIEGSAGNKHNSNQGNNAQDGSCPHGNALDEVIIHTFEAPNEDTDLDEKEQCEKIQCYIVIVWKSMVLILTLMLFLLPLCILLTLADNWISMKYVLSTLVIIQCPLHPAILIWMDKNLSQALRRLRLKIVSLRCICYCNIGRGKSCFGRPAKYT